MSWRNLLVANPATLSLKDAQLVCSRLGEEALPIPLEDIASVILESRQVTITAPLLTAMAGQGVALITCDETHMPNGVLLPMGTHSRTLATFKKQIAWTLPFKKRLWQKIVRQKIINQYQLLLHLGRADKPLLSLAEQVDSGDTKNREAQAARRYFALLFPHFRRRDDDRRNAALNYGYAVVRATIARELAHFGFHAALGIFHHNELNAFNLADDLLEPFRPLVDGWANTLPDDEHKTLSLADRATLAKVLQLECLIDNEQHRLQHAVHLCVKSLSGMCEKNDYSQLLLPQWDGVAKLKQTE